MVTPEPATSVVPNLTAVATVALPVWSVMSEKAAKARLVIVLNGIVPLVTATLVMFTTPVPLGVMLMSMLPSVPSAASELPLRLTPAAAALVASVVDSISVRPVKLPVKTTPETVPPVMATALDACVAMEPRPNAVRACGTSVNATVPILTEPEPLGVNARPPFVLIAVIALPSMRTLSTSMLAVPSFRAVAVPVALYTTLGAAAGPPSMCSSWEKLSLIFSLVMFVATVQSPYM